MAKILVTGSNGQLGWELQQLVKKNNQNQFIFTDVDTLNITKVNDIDTFIKNNPVDFIVNCAAYTAVDKAESDQENAFLLNTVAVDFLIDAAELCNATLIQISTDYVFDGSKNVPYQEDTATFPVSVYGNTKNEAEKLILYSGINSYIIRTSWLYSTHGNNFVKTMLNLATRQNEINVVFDQVGSPTYAHDLAKAVLTIIDQIDKNKGGKNVQEIYHYTNEGVTSWYDLAKEIFRYKNIPVKVNPVYSSAFKTAAQRPSFSVLDKTKIKTDFDIEIPHWVDSLHQMLDTL